MTKIKTGDVFQRTVKGPNYIALGKAKDSEGETLIIATKNGNIRLDGQAKIGHKITRSRAKNIKLGKKGNRLALYAFYAKDIANIHGSREVQLNTVWERGQAEDVGVEVKVMSNRTGVKTSAPVLS